MECKTFPMSDLYQFYLTFKVLFSGTIFLQIK